MTSDEPRNTGAGDRSHAAANRSPLLYATAVLLLLVVGLILTARALHVSPAALIGFPVVMLVITALILVLLVISRDSGRAAPGEPLEGRLDFVEIQQLLMANISHELRTPLNVALGYSEMLRDGALGEMTEQQVDAAKECHEAGQRILHIVTDILDVGRARTYAMPLAPQQLDLKEFAERVALLLAGQARDGDVSLQVEVPDDLPAIEADERALKQLLYHLLLGAIARSSAGQSVSLGAAPDEEAVRVAVTDSGPPMSDREIAEALTRAPETIADEGALAPNAVGLPLCAALAQKVGGRLSITSSPEATSFTFQLPVAETDG